MIDDLVLDEVEFDGIVDFNGRIGVTDRTTIMADDVGDTFGTELVFAHFAEFEIGFFRADPVNSESALDIVEQTEVFARSLNSDDVYKDQQPT